MDVILSLLIIVLTPIPKDSVSLLVRWIVKCKASIPVSERTIALLLFIPLPAIISILPFACFTSSFIFSIPSIALSCCPEVNTRSTPKSIRLESVDFEFLQSQKHDEM